MSLETRPLSVPSISGSSKSSGGFGPNHMAGFLAGLGKRCSLCSRTKQVPVNIASRKCPTFPSVLHPTILPSTTTLRLRNTYMASSRRNVQMSRCQGTPPSALDFVSNADPHHGGRDPPCRAYPRLALLYFLSRDTCSRHVNIRPC